MIKDYPGRKAEKTTASSPLPAGGYVVKILNAKVESYDWGEVLVLAFDVCEGEHKDFFRKQFNANTNEDKKWKGTYRTTVPDENSKYFEGNRRAFNNLIYALEDSNSGYHYDCDELKFKGKLLGALYRNKEWSFNGKTGWTTECCAVTDVKAIREGDFKMPKDKPLNAEKAAVQSSSAPMNDLTDDDDLPFD